MSTDTPSADNSRAPTQKAQDNEQVRWVDWHVYNSDQDQLNDRVLRFKQVTRVAHRYDVSRQRAGDLIDHGDIEPPTEEELL